MVEWHHLLDGHRFVCTPGVGDGQGGLACCDSWGHKESDLTERLNGTEVNLLLEPLSHFPWCPTPRGCHRALAEPPETQQVPPGCLFYRW